MSAKLNGFFAHSQRQPIAVRLHFCHRPDGAQLTGSITTYLVILLQFELSDGPNDRRAVAVATIASTTAMSIVHASRR